MTLRTIKPGNLLPVFILIFACSGSSWATDTICSSADSDPDGDGWGWENSDSCRVSEEPTTISIESTTEATNSDATYCSSPAADSDGDGYGWENNRSCVVVSNSTATVTSRVPATATNERAVCSSASLDPDGDGYGWENNDTCVVAATNDDLPGSLRTIQSVTAQSVTTTSITTLENNQTSNNSKTICSSALFDSDGDGYGWENNNTCIVQTVTPLSKMRIMAVGDSITHGVRTGYAQSYRRQFTNLLNLNSCLHEMVGSQRGNFQHDSYVSMHEGYSGHTADQLLYGHTDSAGTNKGISKMVSDNNPDVVLLHVGSNDMRMSHNIEDTVSEIDQIISIIHSADATTTVLLANLIPWLSNPVIEQSVKTLGDRIEAYVAQLGNSRVKLVDVRTGFQPHMMLPDAVHPAPEGEAHMAKRFYQTYNDAGLCP